MNDYYPDGVDIWSQHSNSPFREDEPGEYERDYVDRGGYVGRDDLMDYQDEERGNEADRRI